MSHLQIFVFLIVLISGIFSQAQSPRRSSRGGESTSSGTSGSREGGRAKGYLLETLFYYGAGSSKANPATVTGWPTLTNQIESNSVFYSVKFGRIYGSGFYLGALYSVRADVRGTVTTPGRSQALGLGYVSEFGGSVRFHYHLGETYGDFSEGKGGSTELGYYLKLSSQISLGFLLTHQQIQYLKNPTHLAFQ